MSNGSNLFSESPVRAAGRPLIGRFRLKHILLATWLSSIVLAVLLLGGVFDVIFGRFQENAARDKINAGIAALSRDIAAKRDAMLRDADAIARRDTLVTALNFIDSQKDGAAFRTFPVEADKEAVARQLNNQIQLLDYSLISVYATRSTLVAYARKMHGQDVDAGYLSSSGNHPMVMALSHDPGEAPAPIAPPYLLSQLAAWPATEAGAAPTADFLPLADGQIALRASAPVRRVFPDGTARTVGAVHLVQIIDDGFLRSLANRQGVEFGFKIPGSPAIGHDPERTFVADGAPVPALVPGGNLPPLAWRAGGDGLAGLVHIPLSGGKGAIFSVHDRKSDLSSALASFRASVLPVLIFIGLALMTIGAVFLNHVIFKPLGGLTAAVNDLKAGRPAALDPTDGPIEIADLARAFDDMARAIDERKNSLHLLNTELERRVEERSRELIESQERYRDYVDTASDWVWEMGPDLRFTYFSERLRDIAGIDPATIIGRKRQEISAPGTDSQAWRAHLDDLDARRPFRDFRYPLRRPDGASVHISISGKPVFDARGAFQGYRGVGTNVTAIVAAERQTHEARRLAELASRTKSEFLANVSHELRTPLNAILGYSDVMRNRIFGPVENERYRQYVEDIYQSGAHLLQLINDILDVSAIEAGKLDLQESDCQVVVLIDTAVRMVGTRAENKGLTLRAAVADNLPRLFADERRMKQILINLLSNAVKFTKTGKNVWIAADIVADGSVQIVVGDEGIGMEAEDVLKALQPFGRTRGGIAVAEEGTGLGLPLARSLVEAHGGTLTVDSTPGKGTTVTLLFPASRVVQAAADPLPRQPAVGHRQTPIGEIG